MEKKKIYLDDVRTPNDNSWIIVRNYDEFVSNVSEIGLENIEVISLDHDLGDSAMQEWYNNVRTFGKIDYNNITEKTGYDCAKWLIEQWVFGKPVVDVYTHSANFVGALNIIGVINGYRKHNGLNENCKRVKIPHTVKE